MPEMEVSLYPSRHLLIDADALLWKWVEQNQEEIWWPGSEDERTAACNVRQAADDVGQEIQLLKELAGATTVSAIFGPLKKRNFRNKLWPAYKMHRRRADSPVGLAMVKKIVLSDWGTSAQVAPEELEADDVLGQLMTWPENLDMRILWSPDKDMKQIPGYHMDDAGAITQVTETQGDYWHMYQTLVGDTSDGYPGCPGIGPVKAEKVLGMPPNWQDVVGAYKAAKLTEADALVQARVARILRHGEKPGEWTP